MRVAVESWAPEYSSAMSTSGDMTPTHGAVDVNVELPAARWEPRRPPAGTSEPGEVLFVDGVRRIDAQVWLTDDDQVPHLGLCVSYAAGTVRSDGRATVESCEVRRGLFGVAGAPTLATRSARYEAKAVAGDDVDALVGAVQQRMGELEIEVAAAAAPADLVVVDGPLSGRQNVPGAIGYVKTHRVTYLPDLVSDIVRRLAPGERTPLFVTQTSWSRYSWYLRLPFGGDAHPWAGVVRCEASADLELEEAIGMADAATAALPRFASEPHKDGRAPQNLYPIAGLERHLRRMLGDQSFLYRQLRAVAG
jgi:uncharacterized protein